MAKHGKHGMARREVVDDNLAGMAEIKPVYLRGSGISTPRMPRIQQSQSMALINALGKFASKQMRTQVNAENERMKLDGAILAAQGVAADQIELNGGNSEAVAGHAMMMGKTISSSLVIGQREWIKQKGFMESPEAFRANYSARMADAVTGAETNDIATAIRDEYVKQMPGLVAEHAVSRAEYIEKQTFDAMVTSIDIVSQDPTGEDALIAFSDTDNPDGPNSYLTPARRKAALARGVQVAFVNGNPAAYGILRRAGVLDQLTLEQRNSVENSRTQFTNRVLATADADFIAQMAGIDEQIEHGELLYEPALDLYTSAYAEHGIEISGATRGLVYKKVHEAQDLVGRTLMVDYTRAIQAGDLDEAARISAWAIEGAETGHRDVQGPLITSGANKGTRAQGFMQITWLTAQRPGYGVRPAQNSTPEELRRTGQDYWAAMFKGSALGIGALPWPPGDIASAAVAYNAGPLNGTNFYNSGGNYSVLPKPAETKAYVKEVLKRMADTANPTLQQKFVHAVALKDGIELDARIQAAGEWHRLMNPVLKAYAETGDQSAFDQDVANAYKLAGQKETLETVNQLAGQERKILSTIEATRSADQAEIDKAKFKADVAPEQVAFAAALADTTGNSETRGKAYQALKDAYERASGEMDAGEQATYMSQLIDSGVKKFSAIQPRLAKRRISVAEMNNAVQKNDLTLLNEDQKEEVLAKENARLEAALGETRNKMTDTKTTPTEKDQMIAEMGVQAYAEQFYKYQYVPKDQRQELTAAINKGLLDKDTGEIRPGALDAIRKYAAMKEIDRVGNVRDMMLGPKAQAMAEAVMKMKGPFGTYEEAMTYVGQNLIPRTEKQVNAFAEAIGLDERVTNAVQERLDEIDHNLWQTIWSDRSDVLDINNHTDWEIDSLGSPEEREQAEAILKEEVLRLHVMNPTNEPSHLTELAMQNIRVRSAAIGANYVYTNFNIMERMFGAKAQHYDQDGIINKVVTEYLASPAMLDAHKGLDDTNWTEWLPSFIQSGVSSLAEMVPDALSPNKKGDIVDWSRGMSFNEAKTVLQRKVRPLNSYNTPDRRHVFVEIHNREGNVGDTIEIDFVKAGEYYMEQHPFYRNQDVITPPAPVQLDVDGNPLNLLQPMLNQ